MLRRNISIYLFILTSFFHLHATDKFYHQSENQCKIQVDLSDISLQQDGVYYIPSKGPAIKVDALQFENGSYVITAPKNIIEDVLGIWWCYKCQNYNSRFSPNCAYCGNPREK